jgi:hypothetical protein
MAGQKATIDKDSSDYLSKSAAPDSERETAYKSQKQVEGPNTNDGLAGDRDGNGKDVFSGNTKKDKSRKADQSTLGTAGDMYNSMDTATLESASPFRSVLAKRFGLSEAENPGVAQSPTTSDAPSLGMMSINNSDFKQGKVDVKSKLESIALQAAEAFEALDENNNIPDSLSSELDQCSKVIDKLYEYVTNNQLGTPGTGNTPVENDPATMPVRRESKKMSKKAIKESKKAGETYATATHSPSAVKKPTRKFQIKAKSADGEKILSEKMKKKACKCAMEEMTATGAYVMVEMVKAPFSKKQKKMKKMFKKQKKLAKLSESAVNAKNIMKEAASSVLTRLINERD